MRSLHEKIAGEILPQCAERLKREGVISAYYVDTKQFEIFPIKDSEPVTIRPDLVLCLADKRKVAVEVANPRDPKRFVGELISPHFLVSSKKVDAAIVFVLPYVDSRKVKRIDSRPMVQDIALGIKGISSPKIIGIHLDTSNSETICNVLHDSLKDYQRNGKFY